MSPNSLIADLQHLLAAPSRVLTAPQVVERLSRDFYWYSPVLRKQLDGKVAEVAVQPINVDEIRAVLKYAIAHKIPITTRGAGTGNYGQAVPLHGGIVLDLSLMDKLIEITPEGVAVCEPGVRLAPLEIEARKQGWELRCYPSTLAKATVGGFLGGGSGGIGSVRHGGLRDFATVRAIEVMTMEDEPRLVMHEGEEVHEIMHSWGTNGILTRIWLALAPAVEWSQFVAAFDTFEAAYEFARKITVSEEWTKRLVAVFEWPIPSFFKTIPQTIVEGKSNIFFMIARDQVEKLQQATLAAGGRVPFTGDYEGPRTQPLLSDYTWNHTTLWAMKIDPEFTYLQCAFSMEKFWEQFHHLRAKFGDEILMHIEFMKTGDGSMIPASIPLVRYTTEERLNQIIDECRAIGVGVANPHVNNVEGGGRFRADHIQLQAKYRNDPHGLLNPGKMISFRQETVKK